MKSTAVCIAALAALSLAACGQSADPNPSAPTSAPVPATAAPAAAAAAAPGAPAGAAAASAGSPAPVDTSGIPMTVEVLPAYVGPGAESRTVNCQIFTALQLDASTGAEAARYQAATDAWALQNRREMDGDANAAAQLFASSMAPYANQTMGVVPPAVVRAAADQCVAAAPASAG